MTIESGVIPTGTQTSGSEAKVNTPIEAYVEMLPGLQLVDDLLAGTERMRERGKERMPQYRAEKDPDYKRRLGQAILFPGLERSIQRICAKPFSQEVSLENAAPWMEELAADVDGEGTTLTQYAHRAMWMAVAHGITHSLIDFPPAAERRTGADSPQPRWDLVPATVVIGWRGTEEEEISQLTRVRIAGRRTMPDGEWGERHEETVLVLHNDGLWELHSRPEGEKDSEFEQTVGLFDYPDGIPLNQLYLRKTGFMTAAPPLLSVAHMNETHWKSSSRQRQYLDFARLGLVFFSGIAPKEGSRVLEVGPHAFHWSQNAEAKLQIGGHPTEAIKAGEDDLLKLERDMDAAGLEPLTMRSGNPTATGRAIDEAKTQADIKSWIRAVEAHLLDNFKTSARWTNQEVPEDARVHIFSDFGLSLRAADDVTEIRNWVDSGLMTLTTGLREVQRRRVISDTVDIDEEVTALGGEENRGNAQSGEPAATEQP